MLTLLGKELRKIRIDRDERLFDMAKRISKTAAFISAVETGKKSPPAGFETLIAEEYELDSKTTQKIMELADKTRKTFTLTPKTERGRETIGLLARRMDHLSDYDLEEIKSLLGRK